MPEPPAFAVSNDGRRLATADYLGNIMVWNAATHAGRAIPAVQVEPVKHIELAKNESVMVVSHLNGPADIWDLAKGERVGDVDLGGANEFGFATSHDWLAYFSRKKQLTLLDPITGETIIPGLTIAGIAGAIRVLDHDTKIKHHRSYR